MVRLIRLVLSTATISLPLWLIYILILLGTTETRTPFLPGPGALVIGGCGLLFTVPASLGMHYLESRVHLPRRPRYALAVLWVLGISMAWWSVAQFILRFAGLVESVSVSPLAQPWSGIPLVGLLFCAVYCLRKCVALLRAKRRLEIESQRRRAFEIHPKALAVRDHVDVFEIMAGLDTLKRAYRKSRHHGDKLLEFLKYEVSSLSDPRYLSPWSLPVALGFLRREIELRREAESWSVTIDIDPIDSFPVAMIVEPAVLCAAGVFVAEYGLARRKGTVALDVVFQESPAPCIEIQTNIAGGDLWFNLDERSPAQKAKNRLVETLNRFVSEGSIFEITRDSNGHSLFRVPVRSGCVRETTWESVEQVLGQSARLLSLCDLSEGCNRVYENGDWIHKVQLVGLPGPKPLLLAEEYNVLRRLEGVEGVPRSPHYREHANFGVLSYTRVDGTPIDEYLSRSSFERRVWFRCIAELSALLSCMHKRGVLHRDLRPDNVLVREDGRVCLIDFDQAVAGAYGAQQVDIRGERFGVIPPCVSVRHLIDSLGLRAEYDEVVAELRSAWKIAAESDASSPGRDIAYYRWVFGDMELPGERDWFSRWGTIEKTLRQFLPGAHVLDLGCNLGLMSTYCALYGAEHVTAVDNHDDILEAGRALARAADVDVEFLKGELNSHSFINSIIDGGYDLVIALSVLHWLASPAEVLRLLAAVPLVVFEGHDSSSVEIDLLHQLGFRKVQPIGYSERLRGLYLGTR